MASPEMNNRKTARKRMRRMGSCGGFIVYWERDACGQNFSLGRKEKALRRYLSSLTTYIPLPSTSTVVRLKTRYKYKKLMT